MKKHRTIFFITAFLLAAFMQILYPMPGPLNYVFMIYAMGMVFMTLGEDEWKINVPCVLMLGAMMLSIVSNHIPPFFKPWPRFALFAMLIIAVSPMFDGPAVNRIKRQIMMGGLYSLVIITVWSFIGYFTGQGQYITGFVNGYMGVTGHPNFLGFFTMVVMIWSAAMFFRCTKQQERLIIGSLWAMCLIVLLVSASRSATGLGLVGTISAAYLRLRKNATAMTRFAVIGVCAVIMAWPVLAPYAETMQKKEMNFDDGGEAAIAATRGFIWDLRYQELAKSPLVGVGAYACDITLENADVFYDEKNGSIELGSSYLGVLSQTGWIGFICFMLVFVPVVWKTFRYATVERTPYAQLMFPLLLACGLHMFFEGYLMTAGAVQCVIVWMLIGVCDQCDRVADYPVFWEDEKNPPITPEEFVAWREANDIEGR